jgi:hypothetical protein
MIALATTKIGNGDQGDSTRSLSVAEGRHGLRVHGEQDDEGKPTDEGDHLIRMISLP